MSDLLTLSAVELVRRMRAGDLSPVEVVEAHITRIEQANPAINALVTPLFEQARAQAAVMAANRPADPPPLWGLPVTVKDALAVAGVRHTGGFWPLRDNIAETDAEAVRRFKEAGAIILGKTNCPDLSMAVETDNPIFGLTRNPRHPDYSAGGSSGGEGAIIAAGGSPLGLGSDIAGSIRIPAAVNGTVGLKPSAFRVSTLGHIPTDEDAPGLQGWDVVGPLARRVEDLALALTVLSETPVRDYREIDLQGKQAIIPTYAWVLQVQPVLRKTVSTALAALSEAGMVTREKVALPVINTAFEYASCIFENGLDELFQEIQKTERTSKAVKANLQIGKMMEGLLKRFGFPKGVDYQEALRAQFNEAIGEGGVIVWPVLAAKPQKHGYATGPYGTPAYTAIYNLLGMPGVVVPVEWQANGLPLSVQVLAAPGQDEVALAAAQVLEDQFGGWRMADGGRGLGVGN